MDNFKFLTEISVCEFLTAELTEKIAAAQWHRPEWADSITRFVYEGKTRTDCFNVIAQNENGDVIGRIFCLQNDKDSKLWYYGDLFVSPQYRRRHIADRMLALAEQYLFDKWCTALRCYVEQDNTPSLDLQKKHGFAEKPFQPFNNLINDGKLMFEKKLYPFNASAAVGREDARYAALIYEKNIEVLHGNEITYNEWCTLLSADDSDERHFLIRKGALPCAYLKINGIDSGSTGWISMLAVEPAFQRKGVGEYAVRFAEKYFKEKGKSAVSINTTEDNIPAQKLYEKCGYSVFQKSDRITGDGVKRNGYTFTKAI